MAGMQPAGRRRRPGLHLFSGPISRRVFGSRRCRWRGRRRHGYQRHQRQQQCSLKRHRDGNGICGGGGATTVRFSRDQWRPPAAAAQRVVPGGSATPAGQGYAGRSGNSSVAPFSGCGGGGAGGLGGAAGNRVVAREAWLDERISGEVPTYSGRPGGQTYNTASTGAAGAAQYRQRWRRWRRRRVGGAGGSGIVIVRLANLNSIRGSATGGTIAFKNHYAIHTFTNGGTFQVSDVALSCDILVVAGGGGGALRTMAGYGRRRGGAGGLVYTLLCSISTHLHGNCRCRRRGGGRTDNPR